MVVERVSIKKVFVGKAMIFGLWFGAVIGIIFAALFALMIFVSMSAVTDTLGGTSIPSDNVVLYAYSLVMIPFFAFVGSLGMGLMALIYNLASVLKGEMHFGMMDVAVISAK